METKVCTKCKIEKEVTEFYKHYKIKCGLNPSCKECRNIQIKIYNRSKKGRKSMRKASDAWAKRNPERINAIRLALTAKLKKEGYYNRIGRECTKRLSDGYIRLVISGQTNGAIKASEIPAELIELKRNSIALKR